MSKSMVDLASNLIFVTSLYRIRDVKLTLPVLFGEV
jgi:hypothetical protein